MQSVHMKCGGNIEIFNTEKKLFLKLYKALIRRVVYISKNIIFKELYTFSIQYSF